MKRQTIMIFPKSDFESDYVEDLKNNLSKKFRVIQPQDFLVLNLTLNQIINKPNAMHFDWFNMYYSSKNSLLKTLIKFPLFMLDVFALKFFQKNIYISLHNIRPHDSKYKTIDYKAIKFFLDSAQSIRAFSDYSRTVISRFYKIKKEKINVFYESTYFSKLESKENYIKSNNKNKKILIFGQIRPYKNIFETLMKIKESIILNNIDIVILGNAYDKDYFETLNTKINKIFSGQVKIINRFVDKNSISSIFKEFDYVLNTSEKFYNSGVLSHCIPLGIPFITKKSYGIEERMRNNINYTFINIDNDFLNKVIEYKFDDLYHDDFPQTKDFIESIYYEA